VHRKDFVDMIVRQCADFFEGQTEKVEEIIKCADEMANQTEN